MNATTLDPRLENVFSLRDLHIGNGEETPQFDGILTIKGKDVATVRNHGRGGSSVFHWIAPYTREWAEQKFLPLMVKISAAKEPDFLDLYTKSPYTALDSMVFDKVEEIRLSRISSRRQQRASVPNPMDLLSGALSGDPEGVRAYQDFVNKARQPTAGGVLFNAKLGIGSKVLFGRENGEKTLGKIVKINRTTVVVETLEDRGANSKAGKKWKVAASLIQPAS